MEKNFIIIISIAIAAIVIFLGIVIYLQFSKKPNEQYSKNLYINRKNTDKRLRRLSTQVLGTDNTPIYVIDNFLTREECDKLIETTKNDLIPSTITRKKYGDPNFRTSKTCIFSDKPIQKYYDNKVKNLMNINHRNSEQDTSQIQKYEIGNQFKPHNDWFDPKHDRTFYNHGQRTWTVLTYLNDVKSGGETNFTKINTVVKPKMGRVIIWGNLNADGISGDKNSEHEGKPIIDGFKYVVTTWFKYKKNP